MSKIIFFDLDGTLVSNITHKVYQSTLDALQQLRENGYILCIATGRSLPSYRTSDIADHFDFDVYIVNAGQSIYDKEYKPVKESFIDQSIVERVIEISKELGYTVNLKSNPRKMIGTYDDKVKAFQEYFHNKIGEFGEYEGEDVAAIIVHGPLGWDYAPYKAIKELEVAPGLSTYADMTMKGVTKYSAIQYVLDQYHFEDYIAFGDSQNDIEMLEKAKVSICMGNGDEMTKAIADYIAPSLEEDGIYKICKELGYIG